MQQRQHQRRDRSEDRADVGDQLHHPVEDAKRKRVLAPVREDPEHPEHVQRDARVEAPMITLNRSCPPT